MCCLPRTTPTPVPLPGRTSTGTRSGTWSRAWGWNIKRDDLWSRITLPAAWELVVRGWEAMANTGKTILITGAGGGIGRACIRHFSEKGWRVIGVDRADFGDGFPE